MNRTENRRSRGKWWICFVLLAATALSYLDRQTIAICAPAISREFDLSNQQFGYLLAAFRWPYAAAQIPAGWIADRLPVRRIYLLAVGLWSLAGLAGGFVSGARTLGLTRSILGIGEAFNTPCGLRTTADVLPPQDRGLGNGLFASGAALGALVAPLVIAPIASRMGWRWAFVVVGVAGAMWLILWWITSRAFPVLSCGASSRDDMSRSSGRPLAFLGRPSFWLLAVASMTVNPCWYFCADWIPKYMHDLRGFSELSAGLVTVPIFLGADLGNIAGGAIIKLLVRHGWSMRAARTSALALSAALVLPVVSVGSLSHAYASVALLASAAFGIMALMTIYTLVLQELSLVSVGLVAGILGALGNVAGAIASPLIGGYVDQTGNYQLIFVLLSIAPVACMGAVLAADRLAPPVAEEHP